MITRALKDPESLIEEAVEALKAWDPERIIVFGSCARGESDPYSDLDLVVIKKTPKHFVERLVEAASYLSLPVSVDVFVYTPEEFEAMVRLGNAFVERVLMEGRVVYEKPS